MCSLALHRRRSPFVHQMQFYWLISVVFGVVNFYWGASSLRLSPPLSPFPPLFIKNRLYFDDFSIESTEQKKKHDCPASAHTTIHCRCIQFLFTLYHRHANAAVIISSFFSCTHLVVGHFFFPHSGLVKCQQFALMASITDTLLWWNCSARTAYTSGHLVGQRYSLDSGFLHDAGHDDDVLCNSNIKSMFGIVQWKK